MKDRTMIAIDLKSFYASVECLERGLDPLDTHLVVADESRTEKTICLAVTPSLKSYGLSGRCRLFEVQQRVRNKNEERRRQLPNRRFVGSSCFLSDLQAHPDYEIDFIIALPRMAHYIEVSTRVVEVYMKYVAPEDLLVYSIDEVWMDITDYLGPSRLTAQEFTQRILLDVLQTTGLTATAGIGPNLYLSKIAMDIVAKHSPADNNGVRIAQLDELSYRKQLWEHQPITDFWRIGRGIARKLADHGMKTMGDVARRSLNDEDLLYRLFGKNAELLIDHAWGWEPCTIAEVHAYRPQSSSIGSGQVLACPYEAARAELVVREMADSLSLQLTEKGLVSDQLGLWIGYDIDNRKDVGRYRQYRGEWITDRYGRKLPKPARGTIRLTRPVSSSRWIQEAAVHLFEQIVHPDLMVRRITLTAIRLKKEPGSGDAQSYQQLDLFAKTPSDLRQQDEELAREKKAQQAILAIRQKYGRNAVVRGMDLEEGATARERNQQIGGHKA